ncbi:MULTISPECIES: general secretion pathway protein GspB [unclassified Janthinobacterium]|uniref:general secretion pathway protein GspB n=1 Tax=unclassified Janthinobacterium TaxID=2610881 RepID=UPI001E3D8E20|nr:MULTISPECIES: general secretion pathway protein GspB [unclassified Janthinobacterium]MCC7641518.1 general secretion pathway protein GspB [Janthinobacterium sp. EB271-G4-3-1]MCC7690772.1 general secretion pathway protein GspB [Janthinobacterium sp. EB271-G4-3-2]
MSYILEALKKSQAERQLGELPSIHAPQVQLHDGAASGAAGRAPVWLALGGVTVAVAAALLLWQPWQAAATAPAVAPAVLAQAVPAPVPAVVPPAAPVPAPVVVPVPVPPAATAAPVHHAKPVAEPKPEAPVPAPAPVASAPAAAAEETVPGMRDLPEPIQRQIPPVAIGGYIYSKNPADRLLLIDKVLRHEGEELAPGLVLEKLQPKAAIFSFKGYRYRVPY